MTAGILVINDAGTVLLDADTPALVSRGIDTVTNSAQTIPAVSLSSSTFPCFSFASPMYCLVNGQARSGGTTSFGLLAEFGTTTTQSIKVHKWDIPASTPSGDGLVLYNSSGAIVFDSENKHARVLTALNGNGSFTASSGQSLAIVIQSSIYKDEITVDPFNSSYRLRTIYVTGGRVSGGVATMATVIKAQVRYPSSDIPGVVQSWGSAKSLILDVAGY